MTSPEDRLADPRAAARLGVLAAAVAGDTGTAYHFLAALLGNGVSFEEILFDILAPLEAEVGLRWHQGDFSISEEHLVTATLETVVSLLAGSFDVPADASRLVVACPDGDAHSLPARMVWAYLVFLGWRAAFLGPGYPAADLGSLLRAQSPAALLLSCTMVTALPGARAAIREAHGAGIPVLAGGAAFGPDGGRALSLGADAWAAQPTDIVSILETWQPDPAASESAAREEGSDIAFLSEQRSGIVAAALASLGRGPVTPGAALTPAEARPHMEMLFDSLTAALLLDEAAVLAGFAEWQRQNLRFAGRESGARLAPALAAALSDHPAAAQMLAAAAG